MKIVVTGGLGYIGSHTVVELQQAGYDVIAIDDLSNTTADVKDKIESITGKSFVFEQFDLQDKNAVDAFFDKYKDEIGGIIHFAAFKAVGESVSKPLDYYYNNLASLMHLLQNMEKHNLSNFIFSSSCTVYGQAEELPIKESSPVLPAESPYGNTKQIGEEILSDVSKAYGKKIIALRYFNPIGAHPSAKIGELPRGVPQNLVPFITQTAIGLREQLAVFGDDYPTEDGTCIRDYIYVVDLAKAHVVAVERLINDKNKKDYEVFNIGTGRGSSVLEVINAFEAASGQKLNYKIAERRAGDVVAAYADTTFANTELGWKAEHTLEHALKTAWDWEKEVRS